MTTNEWRTKPMSVATLRLDPKNPRLGHSVSGASPREIIQFLFDHDKAMEVADSISLRGFFPNEPLLAIKEGNHYVVVEGNRRLAALKALREPTLLKDAGERHLERLARRIQNIDSIAKVPVIVAPNRRATDRQVAGKHVGTPVLAWQAENRANFILEKLEEGYDTDELLNELGFSAADIQSARQTKAIADIARSLEFPEDLKAKLNNPRTNFFSTIARFFESPVARKYLRIEPDAEHGFKGTTTKHEFLRGFQKIVTDVVSGKESSRTLNKTEDMERYFKSWHKSELPADKRGSFVPADIISPTTTQRRGAQAEEIRPAPQPSIHKTVLPKTIKVLYGNERLIDIRRELIRLKRDAYPNAGAVLLRVFFELAVINYLERTGHLERISKELAAKGRLEHDAPTMRQLIPELIRIAKAKLKKSEATKVEKAIKYDKSAPFTLSDLHAFVHQSDDLPGDRDILQFWLRTEPLFRLMVEQDDGLVNS